MNNVEMIDRLSTVATGLQRIVIDTIGATSLAALTQLNRVRALIAQYLDLVLREDQLEYRTAVDELGKAMDQLRQAQSDIQRVSDAITYTAKALDLAEQLAKKL